MKKRGCFVRTVPLIVFLKRLFLNLFMFLKSFVRGIWQSVADRNIHPNQIFVIITYYMTKCSRTSKQMNLEFKVTGSSVKAAKVLLETIVILKKLVCF